MQTVEGNVRLVAWSKEFDLWKRYKQLLPDTQQTMLSHGQEIQELTNIFVAVCPSLTLMAARLVGNAADAEDAVQDAFLSAYTHLGQFRGQAKMSTWLTTIVINAARMKIRLRCRQVHIPLDQKDREQLARYLVV